METMKVLVCDGVSPKGIAILEKDFEVEARKKISAEELLAEIPNYDWLIVRSASKVTAEVIEAAANLKVIEKRYHRTQCTGRQHDRRNRTLGRYDARHGAQHPAGTRIAQKS